MGMVEMVDNKGTETAELMAVAGDFFGIIS